MTLRSRLVISFTVLLLAVIVAVGVAASGSIEQILTAQIDRSLLGFADRGPGDLRGAGRPPAGMTGQPSTGMAGQPFFRPFAELVVTSEGEVLELRPSGFADDPDPQPDVTGIVGGEPVTLGAIDGSMRYRAYATGLTDDLILVRAAPLRDVARATSELMWTVVIAGGAMLLLGGAATWWTVRRAMRPVDQMVETVEAIADGDLSRRVPEPDDRTELGRLGHSVNAMLGDIERGIARERAAQDRLRQFVADASHELRTPLTAIGGYAELHRSGALTNPEEEGRAWGRIESESGRMGRLVEDLLMLTRLGQAHPLERERVDLLDVARDAAADHTAIDASRPVTVEGDEIVVVGDRQRLHQVVSNLLANTRVHTPPGTQVAITVGRSNGSAVLEVADDGPGIPEPALAHIFERFYRADPSRSRKSGGSGLGLSIVDAIVAAHGGEVEAGNDAGGGARLTIVLPAGPADGPVGV